MNTNNGAIVNYQWKKNHTHLKCSNKTIGYRYRCVHLHSLLNNLHMNTHINVCALSNNCAYLIGRALVLVKLFSLNKNLKCSSPIFFYKEMVWCVCVCVGMLAIYGRGCAYFFFSLYSQCGAAQINCCETQIRKLAYEKKNHSHTHKFIKCYLDKLQWVFCGEWLAQYAYCICLCLPSATFERDYSCPLAHNANGKMKIKQIKWVHFTIQSIAGQECRRERQSRREKKIKIMVFFVFHELRNGNGSCFSTSEFLSRYFFRIHSKKYWTIFSSSIFTLGCLLLRCLFLFEKIASLHCLIII